MKKLLLLTIAILTIGLIPFWFNLENIGDVDFITQQIPFFLETKRMLESGAPWWSWNTYFGDNFIGSYAFYSLTSPFIWLMCLFPVKWLFFSFMLALYLKVLCTSAFTFLYFRKMEFDTNLSSLGALLYTFSCFFICNLNYFHFCEPLMMFPLLLLAIECLIRGNRYGITYLSLAVFGTIFINYYFAYISLLIGIVYFFIRANAIHKLSWKLFFKAVISALIGLLLSAIVLIPVFYHVAGTGRSHISNFYSVLGPNFGYLLRVLSFNTVMCISPKISELIPWGFLGDDLSASSRELNITMFGLLPTIIYIIRKRNGLSVFIVILYIILLTPLNGVFSLFTNPFYTRWGYALILLDILATLYIIKEKIKIGFRALIIYFLFCFAAILNAYMLARHIHFNYFPMFPSVNISQKIELLLFVINSICLSIWIFNRNKYKLTLAMVCICSVLNFAVFSFFLNAKYNVFITDELSAFNYFIKDASVPKEYSEFQYRTDEITDYHNSSMILNKPSVFGFHSVLNKNVTDLKWVSGNYVDTPFFLPFKHRESLASLMSVKEVLDFHENNDSVDIYDYGLSFVERNPNYDRYTYDHYIPIGFAYDSYVLDKELLNLYDPDSKSDSDLDIPLLMLDNLAIKEEDENILSEHLNRSEINQNITLDSIVGLRRAYTVSDFEGDTRGFICKSDFDSTRVIFFSVVADAGFKATIDGEPTKIYKTNLGMSSIIVPAGHHDIVFRYFTPGLKLGIIISCCGLLLLLLCIWQERRLER